jgi:hypothetical protein
MQRYVGYVEEIDWDSNTCKVRIPNRDGLETLAYIDPAMALLRQIRTNNEDLQDADIPYHLRGLRIKDVIYLVDSESENDNYTVMGFFGGVVEEE